MVETVMYQFKTLLVAHLRLRSYGYGYGYGQKPKPDDIFKNVL